METIFSKSFELVGLDRRAPRRGTITIREAQKVQPELVGLGGTNE